MSVHVATVDELVNAGVAPDLEGWGESRACFDERHGDCGYLLIPTRRCRCGCHRPFGRAIRSGS